MASNRRSKAATDKNISVMHLMNEMNKESADNNNWNELLQIDTGTSQMRVTNFTFTYSNWFCVYERVTTATTITKCAQLLSQPSFAFLSKYVVIMNWREANEIGRMYTVWLCNASWTLAKQYTKQPVKWCTRLGRRNIQQQKLTQAKIITKQNKYKQCKAN